MHHLGMLGRIEMSELELRKIAETWITLYYLSEDSQELRENFWAYSKLDDICNDNPESRWEIILIRQLHGSPRRIRARVGNQGAIRSKHEKKVRRKQ